MQEDRPAACVLVVDDHEDVGEVLVRILRTKTSYEVLTTTNPIEALERVKRSRIDVVVSDVTMPKMPGTELARHIQIVSPSTRIILMSGKGPPEIPKPVEIFKFLHKPIEIATLLETIECAIATWDDAKRTKS